MKKIFQKNKTELQKYWKNYIFQSVIATISIFFVLVVLKFSNAIVIASIGATVFIIFAMPGSISARPRSVIGGHLIGLIVGSLIFIIPFSTFYTEMLLLAASVGLAMFIMVVTDCEHPPACGTALGVAMLGFSLKVALTIIISSIILSIIHTVCKKIILDLV
jgi:CBS-domain-containing membrane protein